uniref:Uncharacterized protein n=1 Tax=Chenopodium quinoa TaxID=63459 RepID=A0A803M2K6_CHEQI
MHNEDVIKRAPNIVGEYEKANVKVSTSICIQPPARHSWEAPAIGFYKINSDAALFKVNIAGLGGVVRDFEGDDVVATCSKIYSCQEVDVLEAMAARHSLTIAVEASFNMEDDDFETGLVRKYDPDEESSTSIKQRPKEPVADNPETTEAKVPQEQHQEPEIPKPQDQEVSTWKKRKAEKAEKTLEEELEEIDALSTGEVKGANDLITDLSNRFMRVEGQLLEMTGKMKTMERSILNQGKDFQKAISSIERKLKKIEEDNKADLEKILKMLEE